ncbi:MAG: sporulation protein YunB [Oscillospiraceae bacterium]|nr:sporulation protein YunB [Oscillospiraceae bacterium]
MKRLHRMSRRRRGSKGALAILIFAGIAAIVISTLVELTSIMKDMAAAQTQNAVTIAVNSAIAKRMAHGDMDYDDLVTLDKDDNGKVSAIVTNVYSINTIKAGLAEEIVQSITGEGAARISIPFGNLFGSALTSGLGPEIPIKIVSINTADIDFKNHFSAAGINQTRHEIVITIDVKIKALVPGGTVSTETSTHFIVAETVIVGSVPDSYTYFEGDDKWDENLERFDIMN